jgi:hypothetical protein
LTWNTVFLKGIKYVKIFHNFVDEWVGGWMDEWVDRTNVLENA